jgi:hypothetical protein
MFRRKVHKRVRFDLDPLLDTDSESPDEDYVDKHIHESEVLEEDPLDASKDFGEGVVLTENDFWDYVYSHVWSGRLRVCEGNVLRTLTRVSTNKLACQTTGPKKDNCIAILLFGSFVALGFR